MTTWHVGNLCQRLKTLTPALSQWEREKQFSANDSPSDAECFAIAATLPFRLRRPRPQAVGLGFCLENAPPFLRVLRDLYVGFK